MFHLAFDRALLPFKYHRPAFEPLFRLPSEWSGKIADLAQGVPLASFH